MRTRTILSLLVAVVMLVTGMPAGTASAGRLGWGVPRLSIARPAQYNITNQRAVSVTGKTTGMAVRVVINREVTRPARLDTNGVFAAPVTLKEGWNTLNVIARRGDKRRGTKRSVLLDSREPTVVSSVVRRAAFSTSNSWRIRRTLATYHVSESAQLFAVVTNRAGKRLRILHQSVVRPGRRVITWNGRLRRGRFAPSGTYRLALRAQDKAGNVTTQTRSFRVVLDTRIQRICRTALRFRGVRYVWGGMSPRGFDCSGFVGYVYRLNRVRLPRTSSAMGHAGRRVSRSRLRPADILLFNTSGGGISHAGLYLGRGRFVHASSGRGRVTVSSLGRGYYRSRLVTARRVVR